MTQGRGRNVPIPGSRNRPLTITSYKEEHPFNTCTEARMAETWMKYSDLAEALGISPEAARQKAIRGRWRRQRGNDGKALVLVDLEAERASHVSRKRPDEHPAGRPDERRTIEALESHIATLKSDIVKCEALADQRCGDVEDERKRRDDVVAELVALSKLLAEQSAALDNARAELAAYRMSPWWRRLGLRISPLRGPIFAGRPALAAGPDFNSGGDRL
jgi:hypothetical protein